MAGGALPEVGGKLLKFVWLTLVVWAWLHEGCDRSGPESHGHGGLRPGRETPGSSAPGRRARGCQELDVCSSRSVGPGQVPRARPAAPRPALLQTLRSGTWRSRAPSSWPASWRKLPASPRTARASRPSAVWTWWTSTPPAPAQACVAQAASGAGTRTGAPAACGAGTGPTAAPSAEAWLARARSPPPTGAQGRRGGRVPGALEWQPPSSWGPSSSARASSWPWPASSTSSAAVNCPGSATGGTEPPPCSPAKPPR